MRIVGKHEIAGNITSAILDQANVGLSKIFYGEYLEGELRGSIKDYVLSIVWDYGGVRRVWRGGAREYLSIYEDLLIYTLAGYSGDLNGSFRVRGLSGIGSREGDVVEVKHEGGPLYIKAHPEPTIVTEEGGFRLSVKVDGSFKLVLSGPDQLRYVKAALEDPSIVEVRRRGWLSSLLSGINGSDLYRYCWYVILTNRCRVPGGHPALKRPFTMPSKYVFRHQWLWDSSFHAIVLSYYDPALAMGELENLLANQKPDGRIPHEIFMSREACKSFWGVDDYSPWTTQPPVLAIAVDRVLSVKWDEDFARRALEALIRYDMWFRSQRDNDSDHLYSYLNPLETGWDDSPRWDEASRGVRSIDPMKPVEAVDLNSLIYLQRRVIAKVARRLGEVKLAEDYEDLADKTAHAVIKYMWDDDSGFFYDIFEEGHGKIRVKTPAAFLTMFAGIATGEQAERLVAHIFNPREFWTTFPIPSVSADEPSYNPEGYWRGRSWINLVWFTYHGLRNYGYFREASQLARRVIEAMERALSCNENYNSATGQPMGARDFGWSTLVIDIMISEGLEAPPRRPMLEVE